MPSDRHKPPPRWYLDELAHAGPEHLDAAYVAGYDRKARVDPTDELARLRHLGLGEASTLVDLGAGTGTMALAAAPLCRRVIAVDVSPAMLAVLRREAEERGLANVECVQAGFLSYVHRGEAAAVVYARHALHQLPDFWKAMALHRIAAMLRPGGVLRVRDLFLSCQLDEVNRVVEAWLQGAAEHSEQGWTRPS
jgi:ubiquinone/menaquinone biosynthesis C-methylase UbiE